MSRLKRIKHVRIHREGDKTIVVCGLILLLLCLAAYALFSAVFFWIVLAVCGVVLVGILNFFQCPIRRFQGSTDGVVVAPADGRVVVDEIVDENEYFGDRRRMVSIFMSIVNVHANWFPVDGFVTRVAHRDGNFHKAWLPKASLENEHSTIIIRTADGDEVMVRQVAGALARRIVTYARQDEECYIDEHLGFIKFGSRVDLFLPPDADVEIKLGQRTVGNQTVVARLKKRDKNV